VHVHLGWTIPTQDFDLYIHRGDLNGPVVANSGNGATNGILTSEDAELDPSSPSIGTGTFTVHVVYYAATSAEQYTGTASVANVPPPPTPGPTPTPTNEPPGTPRFYSYFAPAGVADAAGEPSIGVNWRTERSFNGIPNGGTVNYFGGFLPYMLRITFDDALTPAKAIWEKAWSYKDHGKCYEAVGNREHPPGFRWLHESFGTNWRLTEIQSAMGRVLLQKLPCFVETRRKNAAILTQGFSKLPGLRVAVPPAGMDHSYYKYYAFVRPDCLRDGWDRDRVIAAISAEGIPCFSGSCSEIYLEKAFPPEMRPPQRLDVARELGETSLMFLVHPTLSEQDMLDTCHAVEKVFEVATEES